MSTLPEASISVGLLCPLYEGLVQQLMTDRLRPSSQSTIKTALTKWWWPFCNKWELPLFVATGALDRGGVMASFVLHMVETQKVVYSTIQGYLWAVCEHHIKNGYASPLSNVRDWSPFMHAVEVEIHTPTTGRTMVPWLLFVRMLARVDMRDPAQVGVAFLCIILFFVISRPEIIPTAQDGINGFDQDKHLRWCDVRCTKGYLEVCLRGIKQDPLCKRKTHIKGLAWRAIGNCTGTLDAYSWYRHHMALSWKHVMDEAEPLFQNGTGGVLTQAVANRLLRVMFMQVEGVTELDASLYSLGGMRPLGRNALAGVAGDATAKVQGMWGSDAYDAYDRDMLARVLTAAQQMANFAGTASMPATGAIDALRTAALTAASVAQVVAPPRKQVVSHVVPASATELVYPDGLTRIRHVTASGRIYFTYRNVNMVVFSSLKKAREARGGDSSSAADAITPPRPAALVPPPMYMHDVVVESALPSTRKAPARRDI